MSNLSPHSWHHTEVRCLAGSRANERPVSFLLHGTKIGIRTILESWREPDFLYFKVEAEDDRWYDLRHHEYEDWWEVRESVSPHPSPPFKATHPR